MLNGLDLFSGIGGISDALAPWVRPITYCENGAFAQRVLLWRMFKGTIPTAPIWDDVTTLRGSVLPMSPDIIFGGFPCQDISLAGARRGLAGRRSALFWEIIRLTEETKPQFVFLENVWPGIRRFIPTIRAAFTAIGYTTRDGHLAASDVGFPHRRSRWFLLAHTHRSSLRKELRWGKKTGKDPLLIRTTLETGLDPNADSQRELQPSGVITTERERISDPLGKGWATHPLPERWNKGGGIRGGLEKTEPALTSALERNDWDAAARFFCRMDNGLLNRNHRISALGNAVVPAQARKAFEILMELR